MTVKKPSDELLERIRRHINDDGEVICDKVIPGKLLWTSWHCGHRMLRATIFVQQTFMVNIADKFKTSRAESANICLQCFHTEHDLAVEKQARRYLVTSVFRVKKKKED